MLIGTRSLPPIDSPQAIGGHRWKQEAISILATPTSTPSETKRPTSRPTRTRNPRSSPNPRRTRPGSSARSAGGPTGACFSAQSTRCGSHHLRGHRADLHLRQVRFQLRGVPRPGPPEGSTDEVGRRQTSALPCPASRCGPWSRRTGAPQVSATRRDRSLRGAVVLVRAGSARHREPPVLAGHERSRPVGTNRSSERLSGPEHG
jgi:hypothetical protein